MKTSWFSKTARIFTVMLLITVCAFISVSAQNMLRNGDAQDSSAAGAFASHAGSSVSIVDDPYDEKGENKCWYICPDDGLTRKVWSYFCQYSPLFEPGESYLIEMDVAVGKDSSGNAINNYSGINLNMQYAPVGSSGRKDHVFGLGLNISESDRWVHVSKTITIADDCDSSTTDAFAVYANPIGDSSVSYYLDNVSLQKLSLALPDIISDNMMLYADKNAAVWGTTAVSGTASAVLYAKDGSVLAKGSSQITDGAFNISLDTSDAAGYGYTLEISDGMETRTINNVAVGELWLLSGQSNMWLTVNQCGNAADHSYINDMLPEEKLESIRFFTAGDNGAGKWVIPDSTTSLSLSAVGLSAVRRLQSSLGDIPVGALSTAYPGMTMQSFTKDGNIYDLRMKPFENLKFRGFMWYQGENNCWNKSNFDVLLDTMKKSWETVWGKLPFIYVQLPQSPATIPNFTSDLDSSGNPTKTATFDYTDVRFLQAKYYIENKDSDNLGMVVSFDTTTHIYPQKSVSDRTAQDPLHPWNKKAIGERLANYALATVYGKTDIAYLSPEIECAYLNSDGNTVVVYKNAGSSLKTADGKAPRFFEVYDGDGVYYKTDAEILGKDRVILKTSGISGISGVAYAYENHFVDVKQAFSGMDVNLQSSDGLPAMPQKVTLLSKSPYPEESDISEFIPTALDKYSVRTQTPSGLRFHSFVTDAQKLGCEEYGYIVSSEKILDGTSLTFDCEKAFVSASAYVKGTDTDIIFAIEDGGAKTVFTAVATNIPVSAYKQKLVVRPYLKFKDGTQILTIYGNAVSASLYETAKNILADTSEEITEEQRAYLEKIISDSDKYDTDETKDIVINLGELYD